MDSHPGAVVRAVGLLALGVVGGQPAGEGSWNRLGAG